MTSLGKRLIRAAEEARAIARGEAEWLDRRRFLAASAAAAGGAALAGPFAGFLAAPAAGAAPPVALGPVPDLRDGIVRLHLPPGFQYRSFHDTEQPVTLDDGTLLPGRHDGMAAFRGRHGNVVLVRNHEVNNPVPAFGDASKAYDPMAGGGTTTIEVTRYGEVVRAFTSLNGTQMNCSGGRDAVGQLDHLRGDRQRARRRPRLHRRLQRPAHPAPRVHLRGARRRASRPASRSPAAGRFAHEAVAFDPRRGACT